VRSFLKKLWPARNAAVHDIRGLEKILKYRFRDRALVETALTHSSLHPELSYERLEFLGDAVLDLVVSTSLFETHPTRQEGELSQLRAALISRPALGKVAERMGLLDWIRTADDPGLKRGASREKIGADGFEALIGALYLDGGLAVAEKVVNFWVLEGLPEREETGGFHTAKNRLQEMVHRDTGHEVWYDTVTLRASGDGALFESRARVRERVIGEGRGRTKKEAEKRAALAGIATLEQGRAERATQRGGRGRRSGRHDGKTGDEREQAS
jgi:ribonuclease-3